MASSSRAPEVPAILRSPHYKWYVVGMLWCISLFPLLSREMNLTPVQLGLLGSAFAWVYGLCAPLAGQIVDRVLRKKAILFGQRAWSTICVATGLSRNFGQLFAFLAAEGLGETFYYPASMSLLSDYHGHDTRSRAMGLHQTSVYMGTVAGGFFAGLIGQRYGWRYSFYVFGGIGILLGFILNRYLAEPMRFGADNRAEVPTAGAGMSYIGFLRDLFTTPAALLLMAAFISMNFVAVVLLSWMPKFLYDTYHLNLAAAALAATLFAQAGSMAGSPLGGWLADRLRARSKGGRMMVQAFAAICAVPFVFVSGHTRQLAVAIGALFCWGLFKGFYDGNIWASLFDVVRPEARGRAAGLMNMAGWLGGGTAPVAIGYLAQSRGLGAAISSAAYLYIVGFLLLFTASRLFAGRDRKRAGGFAR